MTQRITPKITDNTDKTEVSYIDKNKNITTSIYYQLTYTNIYQFTILIIILFISIQYIYYIYYTITNYK